MSQLRGLYDTYVGASLRSADLGLAPPPKKVVDGLDSARFAKMCKDAKLYNKNFRTNDVDIIFTRHKVEGHRKMDYKGFKAALEEVALKRGDAIEALISTLVEMTVNGPSLSGTVAESNRFHDDRSTYTGVWVNRDGSGPIGPTNVDRDKMSMSQLTDRTKKATLRGTPLHVTVGPGIFQQSPVGLRSSFSMASDDAAGAQLDQSAASPRRGSGSSLFDAGDVLEPLRVVFESYYLASSRSAELPSALLPPPPNKVHDGIDSAKFFKMCKDAQLFNKYFRPNEVDIIFARCKINKTARKMDWRGFKRAVLEVAQKRNESPEDTVAKILDQTANGPSLSGTVAESNRFHDDRSTYTGVWVNRDGDGQIGPTFLDRDKMSMSQLCDRTKKATVRGTPLNVTVGPGAHQRSVEDEGGVFNLAAMGSLSLDDAQDDGLEALGPMRENTLPGGQRRAEDDKMSAESRAEMQEIYDTYSRRSAATAATAPGSSSSSSSSAPSSSSSSSSISHPGAAEEGLDGTRFVKICSDAQLYSKQFTATDADLLFAKLKALKRLPFAGFLKALGEVAVKKGASVNELAEHIASALRDGSRGGSGTVAEYNRFYDDRDTWTGSASHGGGGGSYSNSSSNSNSATLSPPPPASTSTATPTPAATDADLTLTKQNKEDVKRVYEDYCLLARSIRDRSNGAIGPNDGIDSARFLKLFNDVQLFDEAFRLQDIDTVFAKHSKARKLSLEGFLEALRDVCRRKRGVLGHMVEHIAAATVGGPSLSGTFAESNRFHDDAR